MHKIYESNDVMQSERDTSVLIRMIQTKRKPVLFLTDQMYLLIILKNVKCIVWEIMSA